MRSLGGTLFLSWFAVASAVSFPASAVSQTAGSNPVRQSNSSVSITHADFHGWSAIVLRNRWAQIIIVPAMGRVMQFNLFDHTGNPLPGPFWNHPGIGGHLHADAGGWTNYGGDKAWPAPQSEWPKVTGRAWPPPAGFDAVSCATSIHGSRVELLSPVDLSYGVRVRRIISLRPDRPVMTIETSYQKVQGAPVRVGIWTVTQLASPERAFILLPPHSTLPAGYTHLLPPQPKDLKIDGRLLSLARDPVHNTMIGTEGNALLWVGHGPSPDLLVETGREPETETKTQTVSAAGHDGEWPEQGSHSKVYTNSGEELPYVEFELLDQLRDLGRGETASSTSLYTLIPRTRSDPWAEAQKAFERQSGQNPGPK